MRLTRRVRFACLAAVAGLGGPLLVTTLGSGSPVAAAPHRILQAPTARGLAKAGQIERQMEKKGFQARRAAYYDARRFAGKTSVTVQQAAGLRARAVAAGHRLGRSGGTATQPGAAR